MHNVYKYQRYRVYVFWAYTFVVFGECLWIPLQVLQEGSLYGLVEWTDRKRPWVALGMVGHLVGYFLVVVIGPFLFSERSWGVCALCAVVHIVTSGLLFAVFSQINHLNELSLEGAVEGKREGCTDTDKNNNHNHSAHEVTTTHVNTNDNTTKSIPPPTSPPQSSFNIKHSWAAQQIQTSNNFAPQSKLWHTLSNGLNLQIEHHLFPGLNHCHLHLIAPVVRQTCQEFGVCYKSYETWGEIMDASLSWFDKLAQEE